MDRRLTPNSGQVAHISLQSLDLGVPYVVGDAAQIQHSLCDLLARPHGPRDRQLLFGDMVTVIDRQQGYTFVQAAKDQYCGWVLEAALGPAVPSTHRVSSPKTHLYSAPKVQAVPATSLYLNSLIQVLDSDGVWARTPEGFIPARHLTAHDTYAKDPVTVAEMLLRSPYYWGGNSAGGVDCSGLVQLALHACGQSCPGDSDLQQVLGHEIPAHQDLIRGDLLFWHGHVAWVSDPQTILHANGHSMDVSYEPLEDALDRIKTPLIARRRLELIV